MKFARQPNNSSSTPPSMGPSIGATAMHMLIKPTTLAASCGSRVSRTTASEIAQPETIAPCSTRNARKA